MGISCYFLPPTCSGNPIVAWNGISVANPTIKNGVLYNEVLIGVNIYMNVSSYATASPGEQCTLKQDRNGSPDTDPSGKYGIFCPRLQPSNPYYVGNDIWTYQGLDQPGDWDSLDDYMEDCKPPGYKPHIRQFTPGTNIIFMDNFVTTCNCPTTSSQTTWALGYTVVTTNPPSVTDWVTTGIIGPPGQ
jgi:hypothetical protein